MEFAAGLESRRGPVAYSAQDERSWRHPNLRLPGRDPAHAGNYTAGEDRHLAGETIRGSELARLRENLHSRKREPSARAADIANRRPEKHRPLRALPAFTSAKISRSENGERNLEPR